jgi:hypothetical protein
MSEIEVTKRTRSDRWTYHVIVTDDDGSATEHDVTLSREDLARLAPGADDPTDLVRRSFLFLLLLAREPKESILRSFELPVIGRYFPEYEREIRT